jgi:hypothetical protein
MSEGHPDTLVRTNNSYIRRIFVQQLFGRYTYDLKHDTSRGGDASRLLILYGDNGSGKTTILQILFHLLHPGRRSGHRSFLWGQIFRKFIVELGDGTIVEAQRRADSLIGAYRMTIRLADGREKAVDWISAPDGRVAHPTHKNLLGGLPFRFWKGWATLFFSPLTRWPGVRIDTRILGSIQLFTFFWTFNLYLLTFNFRSTPVTFSAQNRSSTTEYY